MVEDLLAKVAYSAFAELRNYNKANLGEQHAIRPGAPVSTGFFVTRPKVVHGALLH